MKKKQRVLALVMALLMLLPSLGSLAESMPGMPAARLNLTVLWKKPDGSSGTAGPALPLTDAPNENRLWLQLPPEAFDSSTQLTFLMNDTYGVYTQFKPADGSTMTGVWSAGSSLSDSFMSVFVYDSMGQIVGSYVLFVSSQEMPEAAYPTEKPTEAPIVPAVVPIRYVDQNGVSIVPDSVLMLQPGTSTVYPDADIPSEYELTDLGAVEVIVGPQGASPDQVVFHYTLKEVSAQVRVNYVDQNGVPLRDSTVVTFDEGEHPVYALSLENEGYTVVGQNQYTVYVDRSGANYQEITFVYEPAMTPAQVIVHYVDDLGQTIREDDVYTYSEKNTYVIYQMNLPNYSPADEAGSTYSIEVDQNGARPAEVTFRYVRQAHPADVVIHYVDDKGTPLAPDTAQTILPPAGQVLPQAEISAEDYQLISPAVVDVAVTADGAIPDQVTFTYTRVIHPASVTVHYVNDLGAPIAPDGVFTAVAGENILVPAADIPAEKYALQEPASYTVTVTENGASLQEVTFTYQRLAQPVTVTLHYVDENGNPIAEDTQEVYGEGIHTVMPAGNISPEDYILLEPVSYPLDVTLDGATGDEYTFTYRRAVKPVTVSVHYVDQDGQKIAEDTAVTLGEGTHAVFPQPKDLSAVYVLPESTPFQEVTVDADGAHPADVTFQYALGNVSAAQISVRYVDDESGLDIATARVVAAEADAVTEIKAGPAPEDLLPNYTLVSAPSVPVTVNKLGESDTAEVVFRYRYTPPATELPTEAPTQEPTEAPVTEAPAEESQPTQAPEQQESAPKIALVNIKYVAPDGTVFYSDTATCVEGQDNFVRLDWTQVDVRLNYELASPDVVNVAVDGNGVAAPAEVVFKFSNEVTAIVPIYFRDQVSGKNVASPQEQQCFIGANTVDARPFDLDPAYGLVGPSSVSVNLSRDGVLSPTEVVFQYTLLTTEPPQPAVMPFETPMDNYFYPTGTSIRVRSTTSTAEDNIVGLVNSGDLGHVSGKSVSNGKVWYSVEINGLVGYMSDSVVRFLTDAELMAMFNYTPAPTALPTPVPTEVPSGIVIDRWGQTNAKVNFRRTPDKNGARIDELRKNLRLWIYASESVKDEKWYSVCWNGTNGYIKAEYIDIFDEGESERIQQNLASPVPTQVPPVTPAPTAAPTASPAPTDAPTSVPTEAPAETPAPTEAPLPTATPEPPYQGYAVTKGQTALRSDVSSSDQAILQTLPNDTLVEVKTETTVDGVPWARALVVGGEYIGYIPMSSLEKISNDEAKNYRDRIVVTPEVAATPVPEQVSGYAMTMGDGVPMRTYADTNGEIIALLPYPAVAYVIGQQYSNSASWHVVQYMGMWGFIRQDQMRMMGPDEVAAYEESLTGGTPTPTAAPTPGPTPQNSLSSYGYVISSSGRVNLRSGPSVQENRLRLLDNYAFALVLGYEINDEGMWYHVSQAGTEGYILSDYFKVLYLNELSDFLASSDYINANSNNATGKAETKDIQPVEDYNRNVWQNPALTASYEPFNPFTTATPDPERLSPTATPEPTSTPTPAPTATPEIAPVGPTGPMPEPNVKEGGAPWPWILLGLAVVGAGGAYYAFTVHNQNKKRAALRAQQARQARSQAAAQPQMRAAQNNPAQPVNRPAYPTQNGYMPPQSSAYAKPASGAPAAQGGVSDGTKTFTPVRPTGGTQTYQPIRPTQKDAQMYDGMTPDEIQAMAADARKVSSAPASKQGLNLDIRVNQPGLDNADSVRPIRPAVQETPVTPAPAAPKTDAAAAPAAASADTAGTAHRRVRRTERHKDLYDSNDSQNA